MTKDKTVTMSREPSIVEKRKAKENPENKERVLSSLSYDPTNGEFRWKKSRRNGHGVGTIAGCLHHSGYMFISIDRIKFSSQRLAWLFHTGEWPKNHIDHINMKKSDNRICNLREATHAQNGFNNPKPPCNTSGFKGVSWSARSNKYRAQITAYGKRHYLGLFDDAAIAHEVYRAASARLHGEFSRPDSACLDKIKEMNQ